MPATCRCSPSPTGVSRRFAPRREPKVRALTTSLAMYDEAWPRLSADRDSLREELSALRARHERALAEHEAASVATEGTVASLGALQNAHASALAKHEALEIIHAKLRVDHAELHESCSRQVVEAAVARSDYDNLLREHEDIRAAAAQLAESAHADAAEHKLERSRQAAERARMQAEVEALMTKLDDEQRARSAAEEQLATALARVRCHMPASFLCLTSPTPAQHPASLARPLRTPFAHALRARPAHSQPSGVSSHDIHDSTQTPSIRRHFGVCCLIAGGRAAVSAG